MKLLALTPLGRNREISRLWIETRRLEALGFPPGMPFSVETKAEELVLRPAIIDLANQSILQNLTDYSQIKSADAFERIHIYLSISSAILRNRSLMPPLNHVVLSWAPSLPALGRPRYGGFSP